MEGTTLTQELREPPPGEPQADERPDAAGPAAVAPNLVAVERALAGDPTPFEFYQAVRLLERMFPERTPVGHFGDPEAEVVRFSAHPSIAFPASEIQALGMPDEAAGARMLVNFMGLTGPLGVLPYHYTLLVSERNRVRDTAIGAFFDLFNHRVVSLLYRAWEKHRFTVAHEKGDDPLGEHLLDLIGLGLPGTRGHMPVDDAVLAWYAGLLGRQQRSAVALEHLVEDYFGVPVTVEQFIGGWFPLPADEQCAVGDEIWDPQIRIRLRLGPLARSQYDDFLPTGSAFEALRALVRFFSHDQFEVELQLVLARDDVPGFVLGDDAAVQPLGWSTWIRTRAFLRDADETILTL